MRIWLLVAAFGVGFVVPVSTDAARTARQPATEPAAQDQPPDGPLTAVITAFEGKLVAVRTGPDADWTAPEIGMQLTEGAELRTGPRSAIQIAIPPDQTITLDRSGVVQLLRAQLEGGQVKTDLGLRYGRTLYEIDAAGREHDAKVRSPSSVLAVRGTRFIAYDQPPFAPEAVSLDGRVMVRDVRKQVAVGARGAGRSRVTADRDSPADTARADTFQTARGSEQARSANENQLGLTLQNFLTDPELQVGVFEIFKQSQAQATLDSLSVIGVLPNPGLAAFTLAIIDGSPGVDVNLIVTSPLGEVVTRANAIVEGDQSLSNLVPSGGGYAFDIPGVGGADQVLWTRTAPAGVYTVQQVLDTSTGNTASTVLVIQNDISSDNPIEFGPFNNTLTTRNPTATVQVNLQPLQRGPDPQSVSRNGKKSRKR